MSSPYPLNEHDENSFEFITEQGVRYLIYFLDYSAMFADYPEIARQVFMFNIDVIEGNADDVSGDERIGLTILEVFNSFFKKSENVAVYVCDTVDNVWDEGYKMGRCVGWKFWGNIGMGL